MKEIFVALLMYSLQASDIRWDSTVIASPIRSGDTNDILLSCTHGVLQTTTESDNTVRVTCVETTL